MSDKDRALERLIGKANRVMSDSTYRPSQSTVHAYLLGQATEEQRQEVIAALNRSVAFRKEMREMAADLESVLSDDTARRMESVAANSIPAVSSSSPRSSQHETLWHRLKRWRVPQLYAPALAAAATVAFLLSPLVQRSPSWTLVTAEVDKAKLIKLDFRQSGSGVYEKTYGSAQDAALASFRELVRYRDMEFVFTDSVTRLEPPADASLYVLRILDSSEDVIVECDFHIPVVEMAEPAATEAWAVALQSRNLYRIEISSDTTELVWIEEMGTTGCATVVYRFGDVYHVLPGYTVDLR